MMTSQVSSKIQEIGFDQLLDEQSRTIIIVDNSRYQLQLKEVKIEINVFKVTPDIKVTRKDYCIEISYLHDNENLDRKYNLSRRYFDRSEFKKEIDKINLNERLDHFKQSDIIRGYLSPLDYLDFYKNGPPSESKYFNYLIGRSHLKYEGPIYGNIPQSSNSNRDFVGDVNFVNRLMLHLITHDTQSGSGRVWSSSIKKSWGLFYNEFRLSDDYVESLLPEEIYNHDSERYDDTQVGSSESYYSDSSFLETERFQEKYNLNSHVNFLKERLENDGVVA